MNNKRWTITIISVIALAFLGIGGIVYYGTFVQPGERVAADRAACDKFAEGVLQARNDSVALSQKSPAVDESQIAQAYLDAVDKGIDSAFNTAAKNSDVSNALAQLGMARISYDASLGFQAISALESQFSGIQAVCSVVEPTPTPSASS